MTSSSDGDGRPLPRDLDPRGPGQSRRARHAARQVHRSDRTAPRGSEPRYARGGLGPDAGSPPSRPAVGPASPTVVPASPRQRPRRSRARLAAGWLATVLSVAVLLGSGVGYALFDHYSGRVSRIDVGEALGGDVGPGGGFLSSGPATFLLVGSDSREGDTNEEFQGTGDEETDGQRSDTIILVRVGSGGKQATAVSFPRDAYVTIPAHGSGSARVPERKDKINSALEDGGPSLLVRTVEELSGLDVDHYVQVDFAGFLRVVDALDGVEVCLTEAAREPLSGIDLPAGRQTIRGDQALAFVRQRAELPQGDLSRIQRQQHFLGAVVRKVTSTSTLTNPSRLNRFLNAVTDSVSVDDGVDFRSLALRFSDIDPGAVRFQTVPVVGIDYVEGAGSIVRLDQRGVQELFENIDESPEEPEEPAELEVQPADVPVAVLNGSDVAGLAAQVTGELEDAGFDIAAEPSDAEDEVSRTEIRYAPDDEAAAETLALALPGARLEEDSSLEGEPLQVVLADDDQQVVPIPGTEAAAPEETPSEEAEPPPPGEPVTAAEDGCVQ